MTGRKEDGKLGGAKTDTKPIGTRSAGNRVPPSFSPGTTKPSRPSTPSTPNTPKSAQHTVSDNIEKILSKLDDLDTKIESTKIHLSDRIEGSNAVTDQLAAENNKVKVVTAGLKTQVTVHGLRLTDLENKIEQLERDRRRSSLVIDGVKEEEDEDVADIVKAVFEDAGVDFKTRVCINIYRRGKVNNRGGDQEGAAQRRPRPIVVVFLRHTEKAKFFGNLKNLKGKEKWNNIYFNDDLTELQQIEQRDLRSLVAYAKLIGKEAKVRGGALWYEGRRYRHEDLHRLPEVISLLKAKTLNILSGSAIVFQSPHSPLSNLFPCNLLFRGECFLSAEGAYQYVRALTSGYEREADLIKLERNPYKAKKQGQLLRATDEWNATCEDVMKEILTAKFTTIDFCRDFLLQTGTKRLFEGTGDRRWGCGIPISRYWLITLKCPGKNILGLQLESVRDEIRPK